MWFGSKNGLWRYDAYELKGWKHKPGDSTSLFNNQVLCIVEDDDGNFLVGTKNGLDKYIHASNLFVHFVASSTNEQFTHRVNSFVKGPGGNIFAATYDGLYWLMPAIIHLKEFIFKIQR